VSAKFSFLAVALEQVRLLVHKDSVVLVAVVMVVVPGHQLPEP
jgi:uncharacterized membrane protein YjjP (DUF1212 family)